MSDQSPNPASPHPDHGSQLVHLNIRVNAPSAEQAERIVNDVMRSGVESREQRTDRDETRVTGWSIAERGAFGAWSAFEGSDIPDIVAEMLPPEPQPDSFRTLGGGIDEDALEDARADWRDECLGLAIDASRLPQLRARLERAERVSDAILDVRSRQPLPTPPRLEDYPEGFFGTRFDSRAHARDYAKWQDEFHDAALARETALETVLAEGGKRTAYLPPQFHREWVPRDLMAITALRALLAQEAHVVGRFLDRSSREHLDAMLHAADADVRILDPDDPDGVEIYEGPASEAHRWVPAGVYDATGLDGQGEFRVVVGRTAIGTETTASAAFPPAEHDSAVLNSISHLLESAPADVAPQEILAQVSALVTGTGRPGSDHAPTRLEQGTLLSDLLNERDRELDQRDQGEPGGRHRPNGPDLSR